MERKINFIRPDQESRRVTIRTTSQGNLKERNQRHQPAGRVYKPLPRPQQNLRNFQVRAPNGRSTVTRPHLNLRGTPFRPLSNLRNKSHLSAGSPSQTRINSKQLRRVITIDPPTPAKYADPALNVAEAHGLSVPARPPSENRRADIRKTPNLAASLKRIREEEANREGLRFRQESKELWDDLTSGKGLLPEKRAKHGVFCIQATSERTPVDEDFILEEIPLPDPVELITESVERPPTPGKGIEKLLAAVALKKKAETLKTVKELEVVAAIAKVKPTLRAPKVTEPGPGPSSSTIDYDDLDVFDYELE